MVERPREGCEPYWSEALGPGPEGLTEELGDHVARADAERALAALAEALGEDDPAPPTDPGLPADYEVQGLLGRGAGGVVYRARQRSLARDVAVKVLLPLFDARGTERLFGEARRLAGLRHPGIVQVHEVGRTQSGVYLTLELLGGGSLQELLARGPLNPGRAASLVRQAALALAYTHEHGVVHLDLKPGNVLLDEAGDARVADFGLARELGQAEHSTSGGLVGTPAYMAPEQAADRRELLGERTDVYGLGALLYACLTGGPPFRERSLADTLQAVRFAEPAPIERTAPTTPPDLVAIAAVAMAKDPSERYPTARALAQDLARYEAGEPVSARPPGGFKRFARRLRAHRRELASGFAAALVTGISLLPFAGEGEGASWSRAIDALVAEGEPRAARRMIDRLRRERSLSEAEAARMVERLGPLEPLDGGAARTAGAAGDPRGAPAGPQGSVQPAGSASAEHPSPGVRVVQRVARPEPIWDSPRALRLPHTARDVERLAREALAEGVQRAAREPDESALEALAALELWTWPGAFAAWGDVEPERVRTVWAELEAVLSSADGAAAGALRGRAQDAREQLARSYAPERIGIRLDTFLVLDDGRAERLWTAAGDALVGEVLRFDGRGRHGLQVPLGVPGRGRTGFDFLHVVPAGGSLISSDGRVEAEGRLERRAGGIVWSIHDREVWLNLGGSWTSCFVELASDGLLVGGPNLLEAQRLIWPRGGATMLMLAEARAIERPGEAPAERTFEGWVRALAEASAAHPARSFDASTLLCSAPALRAAELDRLIALALMADPDAAAPLRALADRFADAGLDPAAASDDFFPRGTFAAVTTTGADAKFWLESARAGDLASRAAPGPRIDLLPPSKSLERGYPTTPRPKDWIWIGYLVLGTALLARALSRPGSDPERLAPLGLAALFSALAIDKTVTTALGPLPLDALACTLFALSVWSLAPWSGRWARGAGALLLVAALQDVASRLGWLPDVRIPLALAFLCLVLALGKLDPGGLVTFRRVALASFVPLYAYGLSGVGPALLRSVGAHLLSAWVLWVLIVLSVATGRRTAEARQAAQDRALREAKLVQSPM